MNPFDVPDAAFLVLVNHEGRHSLWPADLTVPEGWRVMHGAADRESCLAYVETHWTELRPLTAR